ncbi:lactate utilization protein [Desulforhopalus singaporensis]|uniref:Uncharacterized ACR, YkgG family COG1556 n=1 Tax=Desulforhopalus singaporensis TaxID=91360 RepID=A0A1H0TTN8_9BACT|nr:lactate utilization protein [Desulforhopalus singaporensis]SDP57145.1 Uncharacterised ACR, YkgG family COG1556 [Desulforhopalus singaporensis]
MDQPVENYWQLRLQAVQEALKSNNFDAHTVKNVAAARALILDKLLPEATPASVSYGGSMTVKATGVLEEIGAMKGVELIVPDEPNLSLEQKIERRRQGLLVDLYLSGTNAVTEEGCLVNLDMIGNRVAAITFGPKKVIVIVGRNKVVADLEAAMYRIKEYAAPANAIRLDCKTPCAKTATCADCSSPGRICNHWTMNEKSYPKNRISVILVNEELGL